MAGPTSTSPPGGAEQPASPRIAQDHASGSDSDAGVPIAGGASPPAAAAATADAKPEAAAAAPLEPAPPLSRSDSGDSFAAEAAAVSDALDEAAQAAEAAAEELHGELAALRLAHQPSAAASVQSSSGGEPGGDDGGQGSPLFADQDEPAPLGHEDPDALPQAGAGTPPAQLAAALRSATEAVAAEAAAAAQAAAQAAGAGEAGEAGEAGLASQPKHVFVFSTAGKPIYAYRRDEAELAGLMATAEAILSVAHSKGHTLRYVRAGARVFAFLERPPLCLVGVSALAEPPAVLRMQLSLVHGQIVSLLTSTALHSLFARNPGYDARKLLAGSEGMLGALVDSFGASPAAALGAYPVLPLLGGVRQALLASLAATVKATGAVHGLVLAGGQVAAACPAPGAPPLAQWDLLLLLNLLGANESFRHSGEACTPVCLPRYNPAANLHAYIRYADAPTRTATLLLCAGMPDLGALSSAQQRMAAQLEDVGALQALVASAAAELGQSCGADVGSRGGSSGPLLAVAGLPAAAGGGAFGATPLLHLAYKHCGRQQYVMSPFSAPLVAGGLQQTLVVAYSQLRAAMFEGSGGGAGPLQRLRYEARPRFVLLGAASAEAELYCALDPLADRGEAAGLAARLGMWLHARHDMLFF